MPPPTLSDAEVLRAVRELVQRNKIVWRPHAEQRMAERGIDKGQVKRCLLSGRFDERPTIPNRGGEIQYEFAMHANIDGEAIRVVASLVPAGDYVVVITLYDPNSRK